MTLQETDHITSWFFDCQKEKVKFIVRFEKTIDRTEIENKIENLLREKFDVSSFWTTIDDLEIEFWNISNQRPDREFLTYSLEEGLTVFDFGVKADWNDVKPELFDFIG